MQSMLSLPALVFIAAWFLSMLEGLCTFSFRRCVFRIGPLLTRETLAGKFPLDRLQVGDSLVTGTIRVRRIDDHTVLFHPGWRYALGGPVKGLVRVSDGTAQIETRTYLFPLVCLASFMLMLFGMLMQVAQLDGILPGLAFLAAVAVLFAITAKLTVHSAFKNVEDLKRAFSDVENTSNGGA